MAAQAGLQVAMYPHHGFHVARIEYALRVAQKAGRPNLGIVFNLCHWLRSGDEANMAERLHEALPLMRMVSINSEVGLLVAALGQAVRTIRGD